MTPPPLPPPPLPHPSIPPLHSQLVQERASPLLFQEDTSLTAGTSYTKMAINGYTWCNMPDGAIT